jgi:hypothetical protein
MKSTDQKCTYNFPGIGESSYIDDPELGPIPLNDKSDTEEIKQKKDEYVKQKIEHLKQITGMNFDN